jgi:O-antigen/teichoic acid export membrane protein
MTVIFGRISQIFISFLILKLATTYLSPNEMGRMTLIITIASLFSLFLVSPIGNFINLKLLPWKKSGFLILYLKYHFFYLFVVSLFSGLIIFFLLSFNLFKIDLEQSWLIGVVICYLLAISFNQTIIPSLNILGLKNLFVFLSIFTGLVSLFSSVILIINFSKEAVIWILGLIIGHSIGGVIAWIFLLLKFKNSQKKINIDFFEEKMLPKIFSPTIISFVWPLTLALVLSWVQNQWYRFEFAKTFGESELGLFAAGLMLSVALIGSLESILTTYLLPIVYKKIHKTKNVSLIEIWTQYALIVYPVILMAVVYICLLSKELVLIFLGPAYQSIVEYVVWGALIEFFRVGSNTVSFVAHAKFNTKLLLWPAFFGALTLFILIHSLIFSHGILGISIALALAGLVLNVSSISFILNFKDFNFKFLIINLLKLIGMVISIYLSISFLKIIKFTDDTTVLALINLFVSGIFMLIIFYIGLNKNLKKLIEQK